MSNEISELISDEDLPTSVWLTRANDRVLALIDDCARKRISDYSKRVGVKTAVMPSAAIDQLIVVTNSLLMLKDLCGLYNVKTNLTGTCSIAAHIFMNTFVSAKLDGQLSDLAPESLFGESDTADSAVAAGDNEINGQSIVNSALDTTFNATAGITNAVTAGAGKRVIEGAANAYLVRRLGEVCISFLRPIQP